MVLDSHCHITCDELYEKIDEVLANAGDLSDMLVMCTSPEELERALELKKKHPEKIRVAFGWFPEEAQDFSLEKKDYLEKVLKDGVLDVLGEIGLDYYWDASYKEAQKELFIYQLKKAAEYGLPVSIHMREASRDTLDILKEHAKTKIIFHCFSGSKEIMEEVLKLDSLISFAGPITYKNNKQGPINVAACPTDRILTETDSPYLSPVPVRGKRNEPANVHFTEEKIAEIKSMDPDELALQIKKNYDSLFV